MSAETEPLLPARRAWERFGVTPRTLDRWLQDERMSFPKPVVINSRRYWRESELAAWEQSRAKQGAAA